FHHARSVLGFLRHYLETGTRGRRFFAKLSHKLFGEERRSLLVRERDLLFPAAELPDERRDELILDMFLFAQREGLRPSESLIRSIRQKLATTGGDFSHSPVANACFVELLKGPEVGRILKSLHSAGVLSRLLPEFRALDGLVTFDGHHQFTVDEHTLRALEHLDRIAADDPEVPERFRKMIRRVGDLFPLRLALLLHDIGKGSQSADHHSVTGGETAVIVCERLGLDEAVTELVEFLVYRHLSMFRVSENRDYGEPEVIESFARVVQTEERLSMLYLLTYIDIRCVGPGTWTLWKGAQLDEVYERTRIALRTGAEPASSADPDLSEAGFDEALKQEIRDHCRLIDHPSYAREILPERMAGHVALVRELQRTRRSQVSHETFGDYHEIAFCSFDRPRLFADYAGLLFSEGFNVLGARIFSRSDGVALDVFFVEVADGMNIAIEERVERMRKKLARLDTKEVVIEDLIRRWKTSYRYRRLRRSAPPVFPTRVTFDNTASTTSTLIEVVAGDRPGLLYDLASSLSRLELDLRTAKVSTMSDRARDVFYVVEADGQKVTNPARRKEIEDTLTREVKNSLSALAG
ncbi:MAG TPA: HD domain-containing protein, partial [Planctomycetota bacterium]|nr:HD domain-containing protein [Planctomycetota bacterium]